MKIGLFTHVCYPFTNGVSISVEQLAKILRERGHKVTIISNNYENFSNDFSEKNNIRVISIPIFYQNLRIPVLLNPRLFRELAKQKFDIVHTHSDFGLSIFARQYSKKTGTPLIHTYHCNYLDYAKENFGALFKLLFYIPVKLYTKFLCYTSDRMIVPSLETKRLLEKKFKIKKDLDYIPNGIDLLKFKNQSQKTDELRKKLSISEEDFVLLCVSRISKEKGLLDIISLLPYLNDCENLKLLIVGTGPEEIKLKHLARFLKLDNVIFAGEIPFDQIQDYYKLGNLFISNSHAETQGLSVIESLSSSIPAACPNTPIYQELIDNCNTGFLFNNYDELISIIKKYYQNKKELLPLGKKAQESVNRFSLEQSVDKIEELYNEEYAKKNM